MAPSPWEESSAMMLARRLYPPAKEVRLEIQQDQRPYQERRRNSETNGQFQCEMVAMEGGLPTCPFPSSSEHGLHRQHPQNQCGVPSNPAANGRGGCGQTMGTGRGSHRIGVQHRSIPSSRRRRQQQRGGSGPAMDGLGGSGETAGSDWSGELGRAGGSSGCWEMAGGETVTASPKSSVSSDESRSGISGGGDPMVNSPAAEWELDCTEEGDGRLPGKRKRKRSMGKVAGSGAGPQQLQTIRLLEPSASSKVQSADELRRRLPCNSMELESARTSFEEEFRKKDENIMQLLQLLKMTSLEREAREMLQELLNKIEQSSPLRHHPSPSYVYPEDPTAQLPRCKSDFAESDSISFTHCHQPYSCSPVEILSDRASATKLHNIRSIPDSSGIAIPQQALLPERRNSRAMELMPKLDRASAIIDGLVMKKPLPEKGKLLQAVMEAGPLLRTLLVAGPLPQWRKPPPLRPFDLPLLSPKAREAGSVDQSALLNPQCMVQCTAEAFQFQNSLMASRLNAASSMKPSNPGALSMRVPTLPTGSSSHRIPFVKRQKI